jgi:hypothetical protein
MRITSAGNVNIATPITNAFYGLSLQYNATDTADFKVNQATGQIKIGGVATGYFPTFYAAGSEKMRITTGGNVGIGTTLPGTLHGVSYGTTKLHVDGGTDRGQMIIEGDSFAGITLSDNGTTANERVFATSVDNGKYKIKPLNDNGTSTAGGEAVTVLHGGNVGIGTTSPAEKLEVNGNIKLSSTAAQTATPSYIWLGNDYSNGSTRDKLKIYLYNSGTEQYGFSVGSQSDVQYHSNQKHDFYIANSHKVRIDTSGNVGIGTTSPTARLKVIGVNDTWTCQIENTQALPYGLSVNTAGTAGTTFNSAFYTHSGTGMFIVNNGKVGIGTASPQSKLHIGESATIGSNFTTAVNNSQLFVHNVGANTNSNVIFAGGDTGATGGTGAYSFGQNGQGYTHWIFYHKPISTNQSSVGSISSTSTATAYNTSSDYRLKENVEEMTGALDRVSQLKPSRFNFIEDADKTVDGFLAHEVQDIVPEAITGEKDAVDEDNNAIYQGIDQSKLVPLLVGAIKELKAEIELLKTQINN